MRDGGVDFFLPAAAPRWWWAAAPATTGYPTRFDDAETATLASSGWAATGISAVCALAGSAAAGSGGAAAAGAVCLAYAGTLVYQAGVAVNSSPARCVQLTWTSTAPLWSPGITWIDTYGC